MDECSQRHDWPKWKEVIQEKLVSLAKRQILGLIA